MHAPETAGGSDHALLLLLLVVSTAAAVILYLFPPSQYAFYPQCPTWMLLHLQCPGCGSTRALAALLHGHLTEALRWNALTVCALPLLLLYAAAWRRRRNQGWPHRVLRPPAPAIVAGGALLTAFTVLRNL